MNYPQYLHNYELSQHTRYLTSFKQSCFVYKCCDAGGHEVGANADFSTNAYNFYMTYSYQMPVSDFLSECAKLVGVSYKATVELVFGNVLFVCALICSS